MVLFTREIKMTGVTDDGYCCWSAVPSSGVLIVIGV